MAHGSREETVARVQVPEELLDMTAEDIQMMKEKLGVKAYRRLFCGVEESCKSKKPEPRANKNRPTEISSKKRVRTQPQVPGIKKKKEARDPRFDDVSGTFREEIFNRDYSFISDLKAKEKKTVQKQLKKEKNNEKKQKLKQLLNRLTQEEQTKEERRRRQELIQQWKEKEKERVKDGKTPYFLKKSDVHKLELAEKFKTLKEKGQVKKFIKKKRTRNASKHSKTMPFN